MPLALSSMLLSVLLAASAAIINAQKHLGEHKLDDVLFDLQDQHLEGADAKKAAGILGKAALEAAGDPLMSLQFAQMALKLDANQEDALEAGARSAFAQQQFDLAEPYADRWVTASHRSSHARLLRARIALDEGDWQLAQSIAPEPGKAAPEDREPAMAIRARARQELGALDRGLSRTLALEQAMKAGMVREGNRPRAPRQVAGAHERNSNSVTLYGTSWCGYCRRARSWLSSHHVDFEDKDVEKDPAAAQELARRAEEEGFAVHGVPVLDVHGTLVSGFDVGRIQEALHK